MLALVWLEAVNCGWGGGQGDTLIWEDNMAGDPMGKAEAGELELNHGDANNGYEMKKKEKDLRTWI
jgi:hypothetical protein